MKNIEEQARKARTYDPGSVELYIGDMKINSADELCFDFTEDEVLDHGPELQVIVVAPLAELDRLAKLAEQIAHADGYAEGMLDGAKLGCQTVLRDIDAGFTTAQLRAALGRL